MSQAVPFAAPGYIPRKAVVWRRENDIPKTTFQGWVTKGTVRTVLVGGQRFVVEPLSAVCEREAAKQG
jgi:hypothetical protein